MRVRTAVAVIAVFCVRHSPLTGTFDVDLTWSQDLSVFTALKEQLRLRLESGPSVTEDSIVIDRVERRSEI